MRVDPRHEEPPRSDAPWPGARWNDRDPTRDFWSTIRGVIAVFAVATLIILGFLSKCSAHDDGKFANSPLKAWFDRLASGRGLCCSFADGVSVENVDWDTATIADASGQSHVVYRVRLNGQWIVVPPEAVVTEPNKFGPAVVWPYQDADGVTQIRCFLPGAGA